MIIGISGPAGAGKDTVAQFLIKNHNFDKTSLADPLKRVAKDVFDFSDEQLWGPSSARNAPDHRYPRDHTFGDPLKTLDDSICRCCGWDSDVSGSARVPQCYLTPRYALQKLGTEWGRDCYPDVWVKAAVRSAKRLLSCTVPEISGVAIPDVRFKNEVVGLKKAGAVLIRLKRETTLGRAQQQHVSELEMQRIPDSAFDVVIDNHEGFLLEELEKAVTEAYEALC